MRLQRLLTSVVAGLLLLPAVTAAAAGPTAASATAITGTGATAGISLSPNTGPVGSTVTVTGRGFPRVTAGTVTIGATAVTVQTDPKGTFSSIVTVPAEQVGSPLVSALVSAMVGPTSATAPFTISFAAGSGTTDPVGAAALTTTQSPSTTSARTSTSRLRWGVATPGGALANAELDAVAALVRENPTIVLSYQDFRQSPPLAELDSVYARGATSLITWEPWTWGGGLNQPEYASARILAGDFDAYLTEWGTALAAWGKPVLLRYGHEMNGNWYPWADGANGNAAGEYAAAWRHVHDTVVAAGATNVSWVWSPNVPYAGSTPLTGLYPGADYVDVVALDGYNWGTSASWSTWQAPATLFGPGLAQLRQLAPGKQIIIAETASAEAGGSKAKWNTALVAYLAKQPDVTGLVWFHFLKETDWRIDSSTASANALAKALAAR